MSWEIILAPEVHDWFLALDDLSASLVRDGVELADERYAVSGHTAGGDRMTRHYRWDTTLDERRQDDPGIDDPGRRAAARDARNARDVGYRLAQMRKQQGMTQAQVARAMGVSQVRVSRMEHGDIERMQVESIAAYVAAIGGHLRLVADFGQATTTFIDYADSLTA